MKNRFERLYTESGKRLKDEVYDAYPRPQLKRDSYFNLNGFWQFCAVEKNLEPKYDQIIRVPFCPESILSGIEKTYKKGTKLCYKREFSLPSGFVKDKVFLHFGAVDQIAEVYLNGKLCAFGQYADFPYDKVYDTVDITDLCKRGINKLAVIVWYYGIDTILGYYPGKAALCYTVTNGEYALAKSSEETLSRISTAYISHRQKILTSQLGYSYKYDMTAEDEWKNGELVGFAKSVTVE